MREFIIGATLFIMIFLFGGAVGYVKGLDEGITSALEYGIDLCKKRLTND